MHQPNPQLRYDVFLTVEVGSAARLLLESLAILESDKPGTRGADAVADPLFAILAMGMEKLTKLTLGLNGLNTGAGWPSIAIMKGYRHNIGDLDRDACALIQAFARVQANGWVQQELDVLTADANIAEIIKTISVYAQEGRFHNLDYLSDRVVKNNSPTELWRDLEGKIIVPPIRAGLVSANDAAAFFNAAVAKSIRAWVSSYRMAWQQGAFGAEGRLRVTALSLAIGPVV
jgi:hypothetical protein